MENKDYIVVTVNNYFDIISNLNYSDLERNVKFQLFEFHNLMSQAKSELNIWLQNQEFSHEVNKHIAIINYEIKSNKIKFFN